MGRRKKKIAKINRYLETQKPETEDVVEESVIKEEILISTKDEIDSKEAEETNTVTENAEEMIEEAIVEKKTRRRKKKTSNEDK